MLETAPFRRWKTKDAIERFHGIGRLVRILRHGMSVDAQSLGDGIRCFAAGRSLGYLLANSIPSLGRPTLIPLAFARTMPALVRSLIFCASTFAKEESSASKILRTNSLSVARCGSV